MKPRKKRTSSGNVFRDLGFGPEEAASLKTDFKKGDKVKVTNGAFMNFEGEVDEIIQDKGTVRIITAIFGRPTPLELEYWQIEKM